MPSWIDLILLITLATYIFGGFQAGLIRSLGGLVGLFVGEILASRFYLQFSHVVAPFVGNNPIWAKVLAFIILFILIARLVAVAFWLVDKIFHIFAVIPGLKIINKLGGAVFGFLEGALFAGIALQFIVRLPISFNLAEKIHVSHLATYLIAVTGWMVPLFPQALKQTESIINRFVK